MQFSLFHLFQCLLLIPIIQPSASLLPSLPPSLVLGRFIIPIGLCLYFAVNRKRMAREEATRVKAALDKEQKKKEAYLAEMKEQGYNLGSVGGSLTKEEEDMLRKVEGGAQLMLTEKGRRAFFHFYSFLTSLPPALCRTHRLDQTPKH